MGDPQAPFEKVLAILDAHALLGSDGNLAPDVHLVSMGDHFDWGAPVDRARASASGQQLLQWLAAHSAEQVSLVLGNHDLCRVGELARFDDATFARARAEADAGYLAKAPKRVERAFCAEYDLPSWEVAARDFSSFCAAQRDLVAELLRTRRFRAAYAPARDLLLCHAGVTSDELDLLRVPAEEREDACRVAARVNAALDAAIDAWKDGEPLAIPGLHSPGDQAGEGRGMFYHRPAVGASREPPPRRRFEPARLPVGVTQAIGHIRHKKCRQLFGANPAHAKDGPLRHLRVVEGAPVYAIGLPARDAPGAATMIFLDGGMNHAPLDRYELFDVKSRTVLPRRRSAR